MTEVPLSDFDATDQPDQFAVRVLLQPGRLHPQPWMPKTWQVTGVVIDGVATSGGEVRLSGEGEDGGRVYSGLVVRLHADEAESYYHNLTVDSPRCFVVTRDDEAGEQAPFLVTLSFDEANAYLEGDEEVHAVDLPAELYRWVEAYVLQHYIPKKRVKRKRTNWKAQ